MPAGQAVPSLLVRDCPSQHELSPSADWSACVFIDPEAEPLSPESGLLTISNRVYNGEGFSETAERRTVAGADEAVFFGIFDGFEACYIVTVGSELLDVCFDEGTVGGAEFAESIVGPWVEAQQG